MSGPAGAIVRELEGIKKAMRDIGRTNMRAPVTGFAALRRSLNSYTGPLGRVRIDLPTVAGQLIDFGSAAATAAIGAGRYAVELASFREGSLTSLSATLGSDEAALRSFNNALTIANQTPLDTRQVVGAQVQLATAGFNEREITPLLGASADLGAAFGARASEGFTLAIGQVRGAGQLQGQELLQLQNAGVSRARVLESVANQLHLQGATQEARNRAALEAIRARRVSGDVGVQAALDAVSGQLDRRFGGALGGFARAQSQTLIGSISNASNALDNLLLSVNLADTPGLRQFRTFIDSVTTLLNPATRQGQRLVGVFTRLSNGAFGALFGTAPSGTMLDGLLATMESLVPVVLSVISGVRDFASGFGGGFMASLGPAIELLTQLQTNGDGTGTMMQNLGQLVGFLAASFVVGFGLIAGVTAMVIDGYSQFGELGSALHLIWNDLAEGFTTMGNNLVRGFITIPGQMIDGFLGGLRARWGELTSTLQALGSQLPDPVRRALGIASPSRVFAELGQYTAEGFQVGVERGSPAVSGALTSLVTPPSLAQGRVGGAGAPSISVTVIVERGAGDEDTAHVVTDALEEKLAEIFGRYAEAFP